MRGAVWLSITQGVEPRPDPVAPSSGRFKLRQELRVEGGGRAGTLAAVYKSETCLERITRTTTRAPARQPEEARDLR